MHMHVWVVVGMMLAVSYVPPIAVGLFVLSLRTAVMLAVASFCGLYATVWSALRPLLAPLGSVATQTELFTVLILSLLAGSLQAALLATVGHGLRHLLRKQCAQFRICAVRFPRHTVQACCPATVGSRRSSWLEGRRGKVRSRSQGALPFPNDRWARP